MHINSAYIANSTSCHFITKDDLTKKVQSTESYLDCIYEGDLKPQFTDKSACYQQCLLYITVMFHRDAISLEKSSGRSIGRKADPLSEFERVHFSILQSLIGKNLGRKKHLQPKLFGWIDFGGTRNGHGSVEQKNPHIHSVALVPPQLRCQYQTELVAPLRWVKSGTIQDIKVEQYNPEKGSVTKLIDYCAKGLEGLSSEQAEWLELKLPPQDMRSKFGPSDLPLSISSTRS